MPNPSEGTIESGSGPADRSRKTPLFREEALRARFEGRIYGELLRLDARFTGATIALLVSVAAAAAVFLSTVTVRNTSRGVAVARVTREEGRPARCEAVALLPGADQPFLRAGAPVRLSLKGPARASLVGRAKAIEGRLVGASEARGLLEPVPIPEGLEMPAAVLTVEIPCALSSARGSLPLADGMPLEAVVELGSEKLLHVLVPRLERKGTTR